MSGPSSVLPQLVTGSVKVTDGTLTATLLNAAPGSDTGQVAVPVRVISSLGGAAGGGDASAANQTTEIAKLTSLDGKTPALGQALAAGSVPVVLTAAQLSTLTPLSSVSVSNFPATQPVSGTFWQATQPVSLASVPSHAVTNAGTFAVQVTSAPTTAVTGTFWQATQPVSAASLPLPSGAATEATLAALLAASGGSVATYKGRVNTFRTPGRAGTTGQKLFALHNATGSTKVVTINLVTVDLYQTVIKAVTVPPPVIRVYRVTVLPTNGTALTKVPRDSALSSSASVTVFGDASADGTSSASALTATLPANNVLTQEFAPRLITAAGYEMFDRVEFFSDTTITLRALEGIVLMLDYSAATQNPITDMWVVGCEWEEA